MMLFSYRGAEVNGFYTMPAAKSTSELADGHEIIPSRNKVLSAL
jgi:hypothetical protein